jgi:hypothetical protein
VILEAMPPALEDVQLHWWRIHFSFEFRMSPVLERRFGGDCGSGEVVSFGASGGSSVFVLGLFLDMLASDEGVEVVSQDAGDVEVAIITKFQGSIDQFGLIHRSSLSKRRKQPEQRA